MKICGVRTVDDALACVDAGADAIGLNFWPGSQRRVDTEAAHDIVSAVAGGAEIVGVFVDASEDEIREIRRETGIEWVQLHGAEPPELVAALGPCAFKAIRVGTTSVLDEARGYPGELVLLDARVASAPGGTGETFDWSLAAEVARERSILLAGGLHAGNVAAALAAVAPAGVDVASGVESAPGVKDAALVRAFVAAAKSAV